MLNYYIIRHLSRKFIKLRAYCKINVWRGSIGLPHFGLRTSPGGDFSHGHLPGRRLEVEAPALRCFAIRAWAPPPTDCETDCSLTSWHSCSKDLLRKGLARKSYNAPKLAISHRFGAFSALITRQIYQFFVDLARYSLSQLKKRPSESTGIHTCIYKIRVPLRLSQLWGAQNNTLFIIAFTYARRLRVLSRLLSVSLSIPRFSSFRRPWMPMLSSRLR